MFPCCLSLLLARLKVIAWYHDFFCDQKNFKKLFFAVCSIIVLFDFPAKTKILTSYLGLKSS